MLPPQGAVPQQQVQGGVPAAPQAPRGAAPQEQKQGSGSVSKEAMDFFRNGDPDIKNAIEMFIGRSVDMKNVPDDLLVNIAGMVHKLGVSGAVAMAEKMISDSDKKQLRNQIKQK